MINEKVEIWDLRNTERAVIFPQNKLVGSHHSSTVERGIHLILAALNSIHIRIT